MIITIRFRGRARGWERGSCELAGSFTVVIWCYRLIGLHNFPISGMDTTGQFFISLRPSEQCLLWSRILFRWKDNNNSIQVGSSLIRHRRHKTREKIHHKNNLFPRYKLNSGDTVGADDSKTRPIVFFFAMTRVQPMPIHPTSARYKWVSNYK